MMLESAVFCLVSYFLIDQLCYTDSQLAISWFIHAMAFDGAIVLNMAFL